MIRFLKEDTNTELTQHIPWRLPDGIRSHLAKTLEDNKDDNLTKNHSTKEALDHLKDILEMDKGKGISFHEMKRMKNWFDTHSNASESKQYELYGGEVMMTWVNNQLNTAREITKAHKEARDAGGLMNPYIKAHDKDRQTTVTKADKDLPTHNPKSGEKNKKWKKIAGINESKTVILSEDQKNLIQKIFIDNKNNH